MATVKVNVMSEGEFFVQGTLDVHEALRALFEDPVPGAISDLLGGVARTGKYWHWGSDDRVEGLIDPVAIGHVADLCHDLLAHARPGHFRKVHCLPSAYGAGENWSWALHPSNPGRGAFPGVEFV